MIEKYALAHATEVRPVAPQDLAPILKLIELVPEAPGWTIADFQKLVNPHRIGLQDTGLTRIGIVAEGHAQMLGLVVMQMLKVGEGPVTPEMDGHKAQVECDLESILVHPQARRAGIGWLLLSSVQEVCRAEQASVLRLEVRASNEPAIRLYERAGFVLTGRRLRYYSNPEEDALLMKLMLAS